MAAQTGTLVSALLRVANQQTNPRGYLENILTGNFTSTLNGDGTVTISTSTGGTSAGFTLPAGSDPLAIVQLAELALQNLDTMVDAPVIYGPNNSPQIVPTIGQVPNSQRRVSYGQFPNCQH